MSSLIDIERIKQDRFLKQNPYAHISGEGKLEALPPTPAYVDASPVEIWQDRKSLENPYAHDYGSEGLSAVKKSNREALFLLDEINSKSKQYYSNEEIGEFVRAIQIQLWRNRKALWANVPSNPIDLLDPEVAFTAIGFNFELAETLGHVYHGGKPFEVAGTINKKSKRVQISRRFPSETRRFTAAHELGHAVMHAENSLHRDRPIDGPNSQNRSSTEIQADQFATQFLMPEKLVRRFFKQLFLSEQLSVDEATAFALGCDYKALSAMSIRELARLVAKTEKFNFKNFKSIAAQFFVSEEAMAIRLEELGLVV